MKTSETFKKNRTLAVKRKVWGSRAFTRVRIKPPALGALKKIKKKTTQFYSPLAISVSVESGGWGGGCRLHCSPHNLSLSIISSLAILTAQKKYNRRETNRNRKPTKKQITTTTKAKKEDPPPRPRGISFPPSFAPPRREISSHLRISLAQFTSVVTVMVSSWVGSLKMPFRSQR